MGDSVNHPPHYNVGKIEVITAIEDWRLGFNLGNAVKYIARAEHKGKVVEDLRKARWYLDRELKRIEWGGKLPIKGTPVDQRFERVDRTLKSFQSGYVEELIRQRSFVGVQIDDDVFVLHCDIDWPRGVFVPLEKWHEAEQRPGARVSLIREAVQPLESPDDFIVATPKVNTEGETEWTGETVPVPDDPGPNAPFADRIVAYLTRQIIDDWRIDAPRARQFHSTQIAEAVGVTPRTKQYNSMCSALTKLVRQRRIVRVRRGMYMGKFRPPKKQTEAST
jgi:hypothetical protein